MARRQEESSNEQPDFGVVGVRQIHGLRDVSEFLRRDHVRAAYATANLEPGAFEKTEWFVAEDGDFNSLVMINGAYQPNMLFSMGKEEGLSVLLGSVARARELYFSVQLEQLSAVSAYYNHGAPEIMIRMVVDRGSFKPAKGGATRLYKHQVSELNNLYRTTLTSVFTMAQIEEGIYYGLWKDGRLVSVAGTHFVSSVIGIAAVGNVYTHPDHRGKGYAGLCTGAVTEELLKKVPQVVLNVNSRNAPAISVYARLGYVEHCRLAEMIGVRKGTGHLRDVFKRFLSR